VKASVLKTLPPNILLTFAISFIEYPQGKRRGLGRLPWTSVIEEFGGEIQEGRDEASLSRHNE
jgi:hypothetical protein